MSQNWPQRTLKVKLEKALQTVLRSIGALAVRGISWQIRSLTTLRPSHCVEATCWSCWRERCPTSPQVFQPQSRTCRPWGLQTPPASASDCTHMKDPNKQKLPVWTHQPPEPWETMINHCCKSLHFGLVFTLQCINSDHASTPTGFSAMCFLVNNHWVSLDITYPFRNVQSACSFFPSIHTGNGNNVHFI